MAVKCVGNSEQHEVRERTLAELGEDLGLESYEIPR